jgi:hypothetical protein
MSAKPTIHVVGRGIVGSRTYRMLAGAPTVLHGARWTVGGTEPGDVVILARGGSCADQAIDLAGRGCHVVLVGEGPFDSTQLLDREPESATSLVLGAAMSPGLCGLIARHLGAQLSAIDEIHVAVHGTAGPACARAHHRSLSGLVPAWRDGRWVDHVAGSGRQLCWFPEPVGAKDCYMARMGAAALVHAAFPDVERISFRRSARRRDRLTAWLPMLSPPHPEGGVGALRVELRGADRDGGRRVVVAGVAELVGTAAAATGAAFATAIVDGLIPPGRVLAGATELPTVELLHRIERFGVRLQEFTGIPEPV